MTDVPPIKFNGTVGVGVDSMTNMMNTARNYTTQDPLQANNKIFKFRENQPLTARNPPAHESLDNSLRGRGERFRLSN